MGSHRAYQPSPPICMLHNAPNHLVGTSSSSRAGGRLHRAEGTASQRLGHSLGRLGPAQSLPLNGDLHLSCEKSEATSWRDNLKWSHCPVMPSDLVVKPSAQLPARCQ